MKYLIAVAATSEETMNTYTGTSLIYADTQFSVYVWDNPSQEDIETINQKVQLLGMILLNIPQKEQTNG